MSSSHDSQNISEGASYAGRTVSADDRPIVSLRRTTGGAAQSSRAVMVVDSSPEQAGIAPASASVNPSVLHRAPALFTGILKRGPPSSFVQESFCSLSETDLNRICKTYRID